MAERPPQSNQPNDARRAIARWALAGPGALAAALSCIAAMPVWLPKGAAGLNNIAFPIIFTPLIWAAIFIYACLEERLGRGWAVILGATLVQSGLIGATMAGWL